MARDSVCDEIGRLAAFHRQIQDFTERHHEGLHLGVDPVPQIGAGDFRADIDDATAIDDIVRCIQNTAATQQLTHFRDDQLVVRATRDSLHTKTIQRLLIDDCTQRIWRKNVCIDIINFVGRDDPCPSAGRDVGQGCLVNIGDDEVRTGLRQVFANMSAD